MTHPLRRLFPLLVVLAFGCPTTVCPEGTVESSDGTICIPLDASVPDSSTPDSGAEDATVDGNVLDAQSSQYFEIRLRALPFEGSPNAYIETQLGLNAAITDSNNGIACGGMTGNQCGVNTLQSSDVVLTLNTPWLRVVSWGEPSCAPTQRTCAFSVTAQRSLDLVVAPIGHLAFVTSQSFDGALGGTAGADTQCQQLANSANLPGSYVALLGTDPAARLAEGAVRYINVAGGEFTDARSDFVTPAWIHGLRTDERGRAISSDTLVWTGRNASCGGDWTTTNGEGTVGSVERTGRGAYALRSEPCTAQHALFCVESGSHAYAPAERVTIPDSGVIIFRHDHHGPLPVGEDDPLDMACGRDAMSAGQPGPSTRYVALVGSAGTDAGGRVFDGAVYTPDGVLVAMNRSVLARPANDSPADPLTAPGSMVVMNGRFVRDGSDTPIYTGILTRSATPREAQHTCGDWHSASANASCASAPDGNCAIMGVADGVTFRTWAQGGRPANEPASCGAVEASWLCVRGR